MARLRLATVGLGETGGRSRVGRLADGLLLLLAIALVAGLLVAVRGGRGLDPDRGVIGLVHGGAAPGTPSELKDGAATRLEEALATSGGITFEIVQTQTITARPGGPKVAIPDPTDRHKTLGLADEYPIASVAEFGSATRDGFYSELRQGPAKGQAADPKASLFLQALVRGNDTYRNDGEGWYLTDQPPGIGLDPITVRLLPRLLRNATGAADKGTTPVDGVELRTLAASGKVADVPGVIAADGAPFTVLTRPIELAFDGDGKLAKLRLVARNTNLETFDLIVVTEIVVRYGNAGELPAPEPVLRDTTPVTLP